MAQEIFKQRELNGDVANAINENYDSNFSSDDEKLKVNYIII